MIAKNWLVLVASTLLAQITAGKERTINTTYGPALGSDCPYLSDENFAANEDLSKVFCGGILYSNAKFKKNWGPGRFYFRGAAEVFISEKGEAFLAGRRLKVDLPIRDLFFHDESKALLRSITPREARLFELDTSTGKVKTWFGEKGVSDISPVVLHTPTGQRGFSFCKDGKIYFRSSGAITSYPGRCGRFSFFDQAPVLGAKGEHAFLIRFDGKKKRRLFFKGQEVGSEYLDLRGARICSDGELAYLGRASKESWDMVKGGHRKGGLSYALPWFSDWDEGCESLTYLKKVYVSEARYREWRPELHRMDFSGADEIISSFSFLPEHLNFFRGRPVLVYPDIPKDFISTKLKPHHQFFKRNLWVDGHVVSRWDHVIRVDVESDGRAAFLGVEGGRLLRGEVQL